MVGKRLGFVVKILVSFGFVAYIAFKVDWPQVLTALKAVDIILYVVSICFALVGSFFLGCKYFLLIKGSTIERSILSLVKINLISRFYALFLPSVVGPDAVRWYKVTRNKEGRLFFLTATCFERLTFLIVLLLCGIVPLFIIPLDPGFDTLKETALLVGAVVLFFVFISIIYMVFPGFAAVFKKVAEQVLPSHGRWGRISSFIEGFSLREKDRGRLLLRLLVWSCFWQISFILRMFVLFKAVALPFGLVQVAWMGSMVLLLQSLPLSFAGIGIREGAYAYLFVLFGLAPEKGVMIGILFFFQMLVLSGIGGIFELSESRLKL